MEDDLKSKIIALVQQNTCIYDKNDKRYVNTGYKKMVWDHIGKQLNIEGQTAKKIWRALRGGYMRYKRALKQHNNLQPYFWSQHLSFLDGDGDVMPTSSFGGETCTSAGWNSFCYLPQPSQLDETTDLSEIQVTDSLVLIPETPQSNTDARMTTPRSIMDMQGNEGHEMQRLSIHFDSIDYLFMSYADTFKRMPLTQQAHMKVEMAKLFAGAELNFINTDTL